MTRAWNVRSVIGNALAMRADDAGVHLTTQYDDQTYHLTYDYVVVARGFDATSFLEWFDAAARSAIEAVTGGLDTAALEHSIGTDLAITGLTPRLHLPMLAGVAQGPGFPNLSCLGLLADRALAPYVGAR
jgi:mycobactin lysine-N-oxygenase